MASSQESFNDEIMVVATEQYVDSPKWVQIGVSLEQELETVSTPKCALCETRGWKQDMMECQKTFHLQNTIRIVA